MDRERWVEIEKGLWGSREPYSQRMPVYSPEFVKFAKRFRAEQSEFHTYLLFEAGEIKGFIQNRIEAVKQRISRNA